MPVPLLTRPAQRKGVATPSRTNPAIFLISPYGLSLISFGFMALVYLVPDAYYEQLIREPDFIHTTIIMPLFYSACIISFLVGVYFASKIGIENQLAAKISWSNRGYTFGPMQWILGGLIAVNVYSLAIILKNNQIIWAFTTNNAQFLKTSMNFDGSFSRLNFALPLVCVWALYRYLQHRTVLSASAARILRYEIICGVILYGLISIAKASRGDLGTFFLWIGVTYLYFKSSHYSGRAYKILLLILAVVVFLVAVFMAFAYARGWSDETLLLSNVFGYFIAPFNHLCAVLDGTLKYPFGGTGVYTFPFFRVSNIMDLQDLFDVWKSEFLANAQVGLNPSYIWITAFGYYYADLGNFVFLFLIVSGGIVGLAWSSFLNGGVFGVVAYPFFASSIALWFANNFMVMPWLNMAVILSLIIGSIELFTQMNTSRKRSRLIKV